MYHRVKMVALHSHTHTLSHTLNKIDIHTKTKALTLICDLISINTHLGYPINLELDYAFYLQVSLNHFDMSMCGSKSEIIEIDATKTV